MEPHRSPFYHILPIVSTGQLLNGTTHFVFNRLQCTRLAHAYTSMLAEFCASTGWKPQTWQAVLSDGSGSTDLLYCQQAVKELCRVTERIQRFLQVCSGRHHWCEHFFRTIDSGEAYEVHLHDLLWCISGLDVALHHARGLSVEEVWRKRLAHCQRVLQAGDLWQDVVADTENLHAMLQRLSRDYFDMSGCHKNLCGTGKKKKNKLRLAALLIRRSKGALLENFRIDPKDLDTTNRRRIGGGSFGTVYECKFLGHRVAVKEYGIENVLMVQAEAEIHMTLRNPYIVQIIGWSKDEAGATCSLVMEQVGSDDLEKLIRKGRAGGEAPFSIHVAVDIMLQISRAMEYVHSKKVIHRDLKPSNVLAESISGGYYRVKLADFGEARFAQDSSGLFTNKKGTFYYRAPEVCVAGRNANKQYVEYTIKADVFSFGITCFEILAGEIILFFQEAGNLSKEQKVRQLEKRIKKGERPEVPADCPPHLSDLIKRCWDLDPSRRPLFPEISRTLRYLKVFLLKTETVRAADEEELRRYFEAENTLSVPCLCTQPFTNLQNVLKEVIRNSENNRDFHFICNKRQCKNLLKAFSLKMKDFRSKWQSDSHYDVFRGSGGDDLRKCEQAVKELWRVSKRLVGYLQLCTRADWWKHLLSGRIDTGEAYDVHLHDLVWCIAGLDGALRQARGLSLQSELDLAECGQLLDNADLLQDVELDRNDMLDELALMNRWYNKMHSYHKKLVSEETFNKFRLARFIIERGTNLESCWIDPKEIDPTFRRRLGGAGGFSLVYECGWLGHTVVVKEYPLDFLPVLEMEAQIRMNLKSPYIVQSIGWSMDGEARTCALVMELMGNSNLEQWIRGNFTAAAAASGPFGGSLTSSSSIHVAVDIMLQISRAMEYLHSKWILHRNLKPSNVLLQPIPEEKGYFQVKLSDFGMSKAESEYQALFTRKVGTSYYRAPELLYDDDMTIRDGRKLDVYSFGITSFEILGGHIINHFPSRRILTGERPEFPPGCPLQLATLISKCWDPDPSVRPLFHTISRTLKHVKLVLIGVNEVVAKPSFLSVLSEDEEEEGDRKWSSY